MTGRSLPEDPFGSALLGGALVFAAVCCESTYTLVGKTLTRSIDPLLVTFLASALSISPGSASVVLEALAG